MAEIPERNGLSSNVTSRWFSAKGLLSQNSRAKHTLCMTTTRSNLYVLGCRVDGKHIDKACTLLSSGCASVSKLVSHKQFD